MAFTGVEKAFCVLQFAKCESIVMVQRRFRTQYHYDPPTDKPIPTWYINFEQTGSLSAGKRTVRPAKCVGCGRRACERNIHSESPRSPDLTPYDFFLWGYVKYHVFVPLCPSIQQSYDRGLSMQSLVLPSDVGTCMAGAVLQDRCLPSHQRWAHGKPVKYVPKL